MRMGYTSKTTLNKPFLLEFYTQLKFRRRDLTNITPLPFVNLRELDLSHNRICTFEAGMPQTLEVLVLYDNKISTFQPKLFLPNLQYLNLGLNKISDHSLRQDTGTDFAKSFPNLMSLDLSHNELCNLSATLGILKNISGLRMLGIDGNPLCLLRKWRSILLEDLLMLRVLDLD